VELLGLHEEGKERRTEEEVIESRYSPPTVAAHRENTRRARERR
jgi:hypothetical protein